MISFTFVTKLVINLLLFDLVSSDYCKFGICSESQYCCGNNKCCEKKMELWYFWAGILLIVVSIAVGICLYLKIKNKKRYENYVNVAF